VEDFMAETQNSKQNVQAPQAGQTVVVNAIPGQDIVLEAAFDQAEVKMDGGNVVFEFANGGQVVLDFTDLGEAQAPNVVMPDGTVLNMQEFLASLGEGDIEPAAGPEGGADGSGGVGEYQDDAGDLLDGVNKLNGLEDDPFPALVLASLDAIDIDSVPELLSEDSVLVEDESLKEGNNEDDGGVGSITGTIVDNVDWGADGFGGVTALEVGGASFAVGSTVYWGQNGAFLGTSGEGAAAALVVGVDGNYTFTLLDNMLLGQGVQGEQADVLGTVQIVGVDTTGDEVRIPLTLSVEDDVPEFKERMEFDTARVEDEAMKGGINEWWDGLKGSFKGTIEDNVKWGADEFGGVIKFSIGDGEQAQVFTVDPEGSTKVFWAQDGSFLGTEGSGEISPAACLIVNSNGDYVFKLLDNMLLGNEDNQGEQINELATVVITGVDKDGDEIDVGVKLQVQDDVPLCITLADIAIVEDEAMKDGNKETWDNISPIPPFITKLSGVSEGTIVNNVAWGADGFGEATTFTIDGYVFAVGTTVYWDQHGNFLSVPPYEEGGEINAVAVDLGDEGDAVIPKGAAASLVVNELGEYTFKLLDNMLLGQGVQGEQIDLLDTVTVTAQDRDGDQVDVKVYLKVQDDVPVAVKVDEEFKVVVDEDDINTKLSQGNYPDDGNTDGSYTGNPAYANGGPANVSGSVSHLVSFGADGGTFSLSDNFKALESQKLYSKGDELKYSLNEAGDTLIATAGGRTVFTLELEADGDYKFSLYDQLDHKVQGEDLLPIQLSSVVVATDGDGDVLHLTKGFDINVRDDVPIETGRAVYGLVEEEMLPGGNQEWGDGTNFKIATGSLTSQVSFGADEKGTFALSTDAKGLPEISSDGVPVTYSIAGNMLTAKAGDLEIFTLELSSNGNFKFTLKGPIDHAPGSGENSLLLNLSAFVTATDFDSDTITLGDALYIKVIDDTPVTWSNKTVFLDDEAAKDTYDEPNPGGLHDQSPDVKNAAGTLAFSYGTDGEGSVLLTGAHLPSGQGYSYEPTNEGLLLTVYQNQVQGNEIVKVAIFEVALEDSVSGKYTVTQLNPAFHPVSGVKEENVEFTVKYTVTDADLDKSVGYLRVNIDDDTPVAENISHEFVEQMPVYVSGFQAGFVNGNGESTLNYENNDSDSYADALYWGVTSSNTGSGYSFVDNESLRGFSANLAGTTFTLGTFTHVNKTIDSGKSLNSVDLVVKFMLNGQEVSHTITLTHNETTNTSDPEASRDIITLLNTTLLKEFEIDGQKFVLNIEGFKVGSDFATVIKTYENAENPFELVASISPVISPDISGTVNPAYGADGPGEVLWGDEEVAGPYVATSQFGTFTGYSDGTYKFVQSSYDVNEPVKLDFKYTVVDGDGDKAGAVLSLTITDASEVVAVDDLESAHAVALPATDTVSHVITTPGSDRPVDLDVANFSVDPTRGGGLASKTSEAFETSAATTLRFDLQVSGFNKANGDTGSVSLQKLGASGWVDVSGSVFEFPVGVRTKQDIEFNIAEAGTYRLIGRGQDNSYYNGNFQFTVKNIEGTIFESVPSQTVTVNQAFVDVDWVAAALVSGSVITNDSLGSEGAVVVEVDGTSVFTGGTVINGEYGALTIHPDGGYSYAPNYAPDDADYVGGPLTDSFSYTLEQPDGDYDTALLTFDVTPQLPDGAIVADSDSDVTTGTEGTDYIFGSSGDDTLEGSGGDDYINGGAGNDYLLGGAGNDHIVGADGNDTLVGGAGDDLMTGGAGSDVFKYVDGDLTGVVHGDTITDFDYQKDQLDLSELLKGNQGDGLSNFLKIESFEFTGQNSAKIVLNVDADGSKNGADFSTSLATITISNLDSGIDQTNVLEHMLDNDVLKIG
jgi:T1SS-143 domain-containing protein